jgi:DNA-binding MarR family transcriptional regulator
MTDELGRVVSDGGGTKRSSRSQREDPAPQDLGKSHTADLRSTWESERPDLDLTDVFVSIGFFRIARMIEHATDAWTRQNFGISGADIRVLWALRRTGKPYQRRPTDLFRNLLVTSGAITKQVDRLTKIGFVRRLQDPNHASGSLVELTAKGVAAADEGIEFIANHSILKKACKGMAATKRKQGETYVLQLLSELEQVSELGPNIAGKR